MGHPRQRPSPRTMNQQLDIIANKLRHYLDKPWVMGLIASVIFLFIANLPTIDRNNKILINVKPIQIVATAHAEALEQPEYPELTTIAPKQIQAPTRAVSSSGNAYQPGQCTWHVKNLKPSIPNTWGNAYSWLSGARRDGWTVSSTPVAGAVGVSGNHVVYVLSVGQGTVTISEMNYNWTPFSQRTATFSASKYTYVY